MNRSEIIDRLKSIYAYCFDQNQFTIANQIYSLMIDIEKSALEKKPVSKKTKMKQFYRKKLKELEG
jgi:hypothetical protein